MGPWLILQHPWETQIQPPLDNQWLASTNRSNLQRSIQTLPILHSLPKMISHNNHLWLSKTRTKEFLRPKVSHKQRLPKSNKLLKSHENQLPKRRTLCPKRVWVQEDLKRVLATRNLPPMIWWEPSKNNLQKSSKILVWAVGTFISNRFEMRSPWVSSNRKSNRRLLERPMVNLSQAHK